MEKMNERKVREMTEKMDFNTLTDNLKEMRKMFMPQMESMKKIIADQESITSPAKQKNMVIDGKYVTAALTKDNRVVVTFASAEDADAYFSKLEEAKPVENGGWFSRFFSNKTRV